MNSTMVLTLSPDLPSPAPASPRLLATHRGSSYTTSSHQCLLAASNPRETCGSSWAGRSSASPGRTPRRHRPNTPGPRRRSWPGGAGSSAGRLIGIAPNGNGEFSHRESLQQLTCGLTGYRSGGAAWSILGLGSQAVVRVWSLVGSHTPITNRTYRSYIDIRRGSRANEPAPL